MLSPQSPERMGCIDGQEMPLLRGFLAAHQNLVDAAKVAYLTDPGATELTMGQLIVAVSNEAHSVEFHIDAEDVAAKGLFSNLKSRLQRNRWRMPKSVAVDMYPGPNEEPLGLYFSYGPHGDDSLDPKIVAFHLPEQEQQLKTGNLDDVLQAVTTKLTSQVGVGKPFSDTPQSTARIRRGVQAFIELGTDPNVQIELGPAS